MARRRKVHKYQKRIDNYYGPGKHKYIYKYGFAGLGKAKPRTVAQRKKQAKKLRDFVWPEMTKDEKEFFRQHALHTGEMGPLWPFVADRAMRLLDISFTVGAPFGTGKVIGSALRIGGRKLSRAVVKAAMKKALKQVVKKRGLKGRIKQVGKGAGKLLEAEFRAGQVRTTGRLAGETAARVTGKGK